MKIKPIFALSLFMLGTLVALFATTNQSQASPAVMPLFNESPGAICPLTPEQQLESASKFEEMVPTFQHPRCLNCHGGVQPFQANSSHAGGKFDLVLDADGDVLINATFGECQTCHGGLPGWEVPTQDVWFVGKEAVQLCTQMKGELGTAEQWIDHITRDRGKTAFIETGFAGMRGLNQEGIEYYEALFDKLPQPEPPPTSHADLINQAQAWVDAMGGDFKGDSTCGCEKTSYAIKINESLNGQIVEEEATITWDGDSEVIIPITFKEDGSFTGEATADRRMHMVLTAAIGCDQTSVVPLTWYVEGRLDPENYELIYSVRFLLTPSTVPCPYGVMLPVPLYDTEAADNPFKEVKMPAYVNETVMVELRSNLPEEVATGMFVVTLIKLEQQPSE